MSTHFDDETIAEQQGAAEPTASGEAIGAVAQKVTSGALLDTASVSDFNKQAHQIKDSAENGGWAISEEGMRVYKKACDTFLDRYDEMIEKAKRLERQVKLGSSPYAYEVADFNVKVANGDESSLIPNLQLMKDGYDQLKEALTIAMKNYDDNEDSVVQQLGKLEPNS